MGYLKKTSFGMPYVEHGGKYYPCSCLNVDMTKVFQSNSYVYASRVMSYGNILAPDGVSNLPLPHPSSVTFICDSNYIVHKSTGLNAATSLDELDIYKDVFRPLDAYLSSRYGKDETDAESALFNAIKYGRNVLLQGVHGVGKTKMTLNLLKENNISYAYFSGPTMDPHLHFIGLPINVTTPEGDSAIRLVLPENYKFDDVEVIFIDEPNRAHPKVLNALMELLQFRSINGKKLTKLRSIISGINPDNGEYTVDALDPAIIDRFHYKIQMSKEFPTKYFSKLCKELSLPDVSNKIATWYNAFDESTKKTISFRSVEEAIRIYLDTKSLKYVFDDSVDVSGLIQILNSSNTEDFSELVRNPKGNEERILEMLKSSIDNQLILNDIINRDGSLNELYKNHYPQILAAINPDISKSAPEFVL
jgi:hypothetical protein